MRRRSSVLIAAAACLAVAASSPAFGQNLFTNPGFETGDFSGWTLGPSPTFDGMIVGVEGTSIPPFANTLKVRSGTYAAVANPAGRFSLAQSVAVLPDTSYLAGGWVTIGASAGGSNASVSIGEPSTPNVITHRFNVSGSAAPQFIRVSRIYRTGASQTSATVSFSGSSSYRLSIDDMVLSPWTPTTTAAPGRRILASHQTLPGFGQAFQDVTAPVLSQSGRVAIRPAGTNATPRALVYDDGDGVYVAAATGTATADGNGTVFGIFSPLLINDDGATAYFGSTTGVNATGGIFAHDIAGGVRLLVKETTPAPGGNGNLSSFFSEMNFTRAGVAFTATLSGTSGGPADDEGIFFRPAGGPLRTIAREGHAAPGGGAYQVVSFARLALNNAGSVAFVSATSATDRGVFLDTGSGPQLLGSASFGNRPAMNENSQVAWLDTSQGGQTLRLWNGSATSPLLAVGDAAPGGSSFASLRDPVVNDGAQVAFAARLADGASGVFRTDAAGNLIALARTGQAAPEGGVFRDFVAASIGSDYPPSRPAILAGGQVAFVSYVADTPEVAIHLADESEVVAVAGWGQSLGDRVITGFRWQGEPTLAVNNHGQVAYTAILDDGLSAVQLFTPTLHWRSNQSGNWSNASNWTVGLAPTAVHPVVIDSPAGINVTTPAGNVAVNSLEVGAGNSLTLSPGSNLTAAEGVTIDAGAFLKGAGTITGNVTSAGTISPGNSAGVITIDGDYIQTGRLDLELIEGGFDQLVVTGEMNLGGDIYVTGSAEVGQTFNLLTAASVTGSATWHLPGESSFQWLALPGGGQTLQITYVPEPAGVVMLSVVLFGMLGRRSRLLQRA